MFEQTFKNIDDILWKDPGCDSELDYIGQSSWIMFLRYLDELEMDKADEAELKGEEYTFILDEKYRWGNWAMPKDEEGQLDHHQAMTGPDLVEFVDRELFPYLAKFKEKAESPQTIEYKIGEIFSELKNKIQSGYNLREIIEYADRGSLILLEIPIQFLGLFPFKANRKSRHLSPAHGRSGRSSHENIFHFIFFSFWTVVAVYRQTHLSLFER